MTAEHSPRTTRDALIHELLGDVGRLHDQVKALPEAFKGSVAPTLGAVALASNDARKAIKEYGDTEKVQFANFTAQEKVALRDVMVGVVRETAGTEIGKAVISVNLAASSFHEAASDARRQHWKWVGFALAVGLLGGVLGGALGFYGSHRLYGQQQAKQAAWGRAVTAVWDQLDTKTKDRIQAARENTP